MQAAGAFGWPLDVLATILHPQMLAARFSPQADSGHVPGLSDV